MRNWLIWFIFLIALVLRIVDLKNHPVGFTPDEASFGYDAYSLLETGKDQWGDPYPLTLRSFGDYKLPIYAYLSIPFIKLLGLNEFSIRLPNALIGSFAVVITYLLSKKIFKNENAALWAAILLTLSPWHLPLSRGAFEANLTSFFLPLGIYLFLKAKDNPYYYILSSLIFGINMFTYHSARLLTPLVVLALFTTIKLKEVRKNSHVIICVAILGIFFIVSLFFYLGKGGSRLETSSIISSATDANKNHYQQVIVGEPSLVAKIFNNKPIYVVETFTKNYLSYFSPQFLLTNGPAEATYGMVPGHGVLLGVELIFISIALWSLIKKKSNKDWLLLLFWILIAPIPAALTSGPGYAANRAAFMLPAVQLISGLGASLLLKKNKVSILLIIITAIFSVRYLEYYWFRQPVVGQKPMISGVRELISSIDDEKYTNVIISKNVSEPQIYVAFYKKINPYFYHQSATLWRQFEDKKLGWVDRLDSYSLGKYTFEGIDIEKLKLITNSLAIGRPEEFTEKIQPTHKIRYKDFTPAFYLVETDSLK